MGYKCAPNIVSTLGVWVPFPYWCPQKWKGGQWMVKWEMCLPLTAQTKSYIMEQQKTNIKTEKWQLMSPWKI